MSGWPGTGPRQEIDDLDREAYMKMKWEKNVRRVVPYIPGEQPGGRSVIKLNTNENPYPPAPGVAERLAAMEADKMRLYPAFPEQTQLAEALAQHYRIKKEQIGRASCRERV